jgi:D-threo-aldose 1-dehydrogenase
VCCAAKARFQRPTSFRDALRATIVGKRDEGAGRRSVAGLDFDDRRVWGPMDRFAIRRLGRTDVRLTELGFGGAPLGDIFEKIPEKTARATVEAAYGCGIGYFDTSPWYGHGLSEHRLGHVLRAKVRASFVLSTKVGRVYAASPDRTDTAPWVGGLPFVPRFDYGRDGIRRSFEDSLQRLGLARVDLLIIHDLDFLHHETEEGVARRLDELEGGWKALADMRSAGVIRGIGAGINETGMIPRFLARFDIDFFLIAMPYNLLTQEAVEELPMCEERGVGVVIGAPFASGILATGARKNAMFNYAPADARVLEKARRLAEVCRRHGVPLAAAALQFPLGHRSVAAVIPGAVSPAQVRRNVAFARHPIPGELWDELKAEGLVIAEAQTPSPVSGGD